MNWESLLSSTNFLNVKLTGYDGNDDYFPYSGTGTSGHIDYYGDTGITWYNAPFQDLSHRHNITADASWSLFADGLFGGSDSHSFKFGALYENASTTDSWRRNGGYTYYDDSTLCSSTSTRTSRTPIAPVPSARWVTASTRSTASTRAYTFYAQDSVRFSRLTVNAGLRYTGYRAGWQEGYGDSTVYSVDFVDPRIGFVWDVTGDARWAIKGALGPIPLLDVHVPVRPRGLRPRHDPGRGQRVGPGHADLGALDLSDSDRGPDRERLAPVRRRDHLHGRTPAQQGAWRSASTSSTGGSAASWASSTRTTTTRAVNGIPNPIAGGTLEVWNLNTDPVYVLTTDNPGSRAYDSLVLRFDKRYAAGWQLRSSLVWTDLKGNVLKNNGYANELKDKNGLVNADGKMDYSYNEWEFKLNGAVDLPLGLVLSGQYTYLSGPVLDPVRRRPLLPRRELQLGPQRLPRGARHGAALRPQHHRHAPRLGHEARRVPPPRPLPRVPSTS